MKTEYVVWYTVLSRYVHQDNFLVELKAISNWEDTSSTVTESCVVAKAALKFTVFSFPPSKAREMSSIASTSSAWPSGNFICSFFSTLRKQLRRFASFKVDNLSWRTGTGVGALDVSLRSCRIWVIPAWSCSKHQLALDSTEIIANYGGGLKFLKL